METFRPSWDATVKRMPHGKGVKVKLIVNDYLLSQKFLSLSPSTRKCYLSALKFFEKLVLVENNTIFEYYVHKVDYATVDYLHALSARVHRPASIKMRLAVLSRVWEYALRGGKAFINPFMRNQVKVSNERDTTWTREEINKAIEKASQLGYVSLARYIILSYETGQRPWADLARLKWENIHKTENGYVLDFIVSKTHTHLILPLSERALKELVPIEGKRGYIFADGDGKRLHVSTVQRQFVVVKACAQLRESLTFRDIRRTAVTELVEAGATTEEIRSITGWRRPQDIMHRYARLRIKTAQNAFNKRWENE